MARVKELDIVVRVMRPVSESALVHLVKGVAVEMDHQLRLYKFADEEHQDPIVVKFHVTFDRT